MIAPQTKLPGFSRRQNLKIGAHSCSMEEAEARKARLAAMRARAGGGGGGSAGGGGGILMTPQMLGAPPPGAMHSMAPAGVRRPPEPPTAAPMAGGFYTSMQTPGVNTPIIESFSMGDRAMPPQRPPYAGMPPPPHQHFQHGGQMAGMGGMPMGDRGRGGWQNPPGSGGFQGCMPGMQGNGQQRGLSSSV